MSSSEITGLAALFDLAAYRAGDVLAGLSPGAAWALALWLVAHAVQRRQAVIRRGPHDPLLPDDPFTARDPSVIGE